MAANRPPRRRKKKADEIVGRVVDPPGFKVKYINRFIGKICIY